MIVEIDHEDDGKAYYGLMKGTDSSGEWIIAEGYYLEEELEKGHLEWIKD